MGLSILQTLKEDRRKVEGWSLGTPWGRDVSSYPGFDSGCLTPSKGHRLEKQGDFGMGASG